MTIYIENVLIDNMIINTLLLLLTKKCVGLNCKKIKIVLSALFGTIFAFVMPLIKLPDTILVLLKLLIGAGMICIILTKTFYKKFLVSYTLFLLFTFIFGGMCYGVLLLFNSNTILSNGVLLYSFEIPMGLILLICLFCYYLLKNILNFLFKRKKILHFVYKIRLKNDGHIVETNALLDSGNRIFDELTKLPVTLINYKTFSKLSGIDIAKLFLFKLEDLPLKNAHTMYIQGADKKSKKILLFEIMSLEIFFENGSNIFNNIIVGLTFKNFNDIVDYDCLLNPDYFN